MKDLLPFKTLLNYTAWLTYVLGLAAPLAGQSLSGMPGAFAPMDLGARSAGLAGAQSAFPCPSEALLHNPASLMQAAWSVGYSYSNAYSLLSYNFLSGSLRMDSLPLAFGFGAIQNGDEVYSENQIMMGTAVHWQRIHAGISWKLRYASTGSGGEDFLDPETGKNTKVSGNGLGLAGFDIGIQAAFLKNHFITGIVVKDLFSSLAWNTENEAETARGRYAESIPISMKFGMQAIMFKDLTLAIDIEPGLYRLPSPFNVKFLEKYSDIKNRLLLGLEWMPLYRFKPFGFLQRLLALRCGYGETVFEEDKSKMFTFGGGIELPITSSGNRRIAVNGGYRINSIFKGNNSFRVGMQMHSN